MSRNKSKHHRAGGLLIIHLIHVTGGVAHTPLASLLGLETISLTSTFPKSRDTGDRGGVEKTSFTRSSHYARSLFLSPRRLSAQNPPSPSLFLSWLSPRERSVVSSLPVILEWSRKGTDRGGVEFWYWQARLRLSCWDLHVAMVQDYPLLSTLTQSRREA
ncbi:hypothetical protein BO94DRAFT_303274 [Aspergillus sclerotioniger CBS 115572]|uniref:Uncharacterized protein n=1 Tax=Aspergillus sclerotioniger CBS 115572 TaxID=1450535 RepID=A0A317V7G4_9EURO|nr:hypothetical protein BO94DRAFT_303274 [Aspergillus sclerotioniger CBS 115572]PWY68070.1 hypothetical protein BO94DRAFT_303274 [Aspergillus sclerotioniger CBS 115572]